MRTFVGYRPNPPEHYYEQGAANSPNEPQYEGVIFDDGFVAVRWLTLQHSTELWPDFDGFLRIHGHPEYGTRIVWNDEH